MFKRLQITKSLMPHTFLISHAGSLADFSGKDDQAGTHSGESVTGGDDDSDPWVSALTTTFQVEAQIAASMLRNEGIPSRLRHEGASSALPVGVGLLARIDVMVPASREEAARLILSAAVTPTENAWREVDPDADYLDEEDYADLES